METLSWTASCLSSTPAYHTRSVRLIKCSSSFPHSGIWLFLTHALQGFGHRDFGVARRWREQHEMAHPRPSTPGPVGLVDWPPLTHCLLDFLWVHSDVFFYCKASCPPNLRGQWGEKRIAAREGPEEGTAAGILAVSNPHCSHERILAARSLLKFLPRFFPPPACLGFSSSVLLLLMLFHVCILFN